MLAGAHGLLDSEHQTPKEKHQREEELAADSPNHLAGVGDGLGWSGREETRKKLPARFGVDERAAKHVREYKKGLGIYFTFNRSLART